MSQKDAYIALLQEQLSKIEDRSFDLSAWKKATVLVVENCFGAKSPHVKAIEKLNYEYNSWALRDESGITDPIKADCRSILKIIIRDLETSEIGKKENNNNTDCNLNFVWLPFEDELTGASSKKLKALIKEVNISEEEIEKFLKDLPGQTTVDILNKILTSTEFKDWISKSN